MGYVLMTKNSQYIVMETEDPNVMTLSGGKVLSDGRHQFEGMLIHKPQGLVGEGQSFQAQFTGDIYNGEYANKIISTSTIRSVLYVPSVVVGIKKDSNDYECER